MNGADEMKEGAAYQAASAGQQTVESSGTAAVPPFVDAEKPRAKARAAAAVPGLTFPRFFTEAGVDPFDEVEWELRAARHRQRARRGGVRAARRRDSEVLVAAGDQHRRLEVFPRPDRHAGARAQRQAAHRPRRRHDHRCGRRSNKYFASDEDLQAFSDDLKHILVYQKAAFNSPVWFNCGFEKAPQCSACFINSVQDTMDSILTLARTEGMLFKFGSGTGTNLSPIRSSRELLAGGGTASGPVSFMKGYDAFAGVIKSGGKTRRAAKMVILNADHPDIVEFINCKVEEEKKAWALIDAGYDGSFTGPAYSSVFFQNSNNSVRVTDDFMRAVLDDGTWETKAVRDGAVMDTYKARELMRPHRRGHARLRRPGHAVRHDDQRVAHLPGDGSHPREQPVLRVHVPQRLGVQPGVDQPDEVRQGRRRVRRRSPTRRRSARCITAQEIIVDNASYPTPGDRARTATPTGRSASATRTSARC